MQHQGQPSSPGSYRELTLRGMILGALITVIFTASNVYLGLKVGLTFASSIPAAVISMAVLKFCKDSNILENNMVQTQASSAGTLSSIIFVLPGLLMLGYWSGFPFWQTTLICAAGGILGVIFTIPLRHVMVVNSTLPYPEGVAAAEILKAGDRNQALEDSAQADNEEAPQSGIKQILAGGFLAGIFSLLTNGLRVVSDSGSYWFKSSTAIFQLPMGFSFALLGAGYLVGITAGIAVLIGMFIAWGVAVPYFSSGTSIPDGMTMIDYARGLWTAKVRYIGAGTIAVAAVWTLITLFRPMYEGMRLSFSTLRKGSNSPTAERTQQDLSPKTMVSIALAMLVILAGTFYSFITDAQISGTLAWGLVVCTTLLAFFIGFLVAAACGYMAGLIGSSSSPISGIGIISIVIISLVLMVIGQSTDLFENAGGAQFMTALSLFSTAVVVAIATISNDNLQDLKTGLLVNATPWRQQVALIIGCIVGAVVIAPVLELLYHAYGFTGALPRATMDPAQALSAPQATLMTTIAKGIFSHDLEWTQIFVGIAIGVLAIIIDVFIKKARPACTLPPLAVGMGIYLPPTINMPVFIGTLVSFITIQIVKKRHSDKAQQDVALRKAGRRSTLFAAGLIVGESLVGVIIALIIAISIPLGFGEEPLKIDLADWSTPSQLIGLVFFIGAIILLAYQSLKRR